MRRVVGGHSRHSGAYSANTWCPLKRENVIQKMRLKVALHNKWRDESTSRELEGDAPHMTRGSSCRRTAEVGPTCGHD